MTGLSKVTRVGWSNGSGQLYIIVCIKYSEHIRTSISAYKECYKDVGCDSAGLVTLHKILGIMQWHPKKYYCACYKHLYITQPLDY